jgi:hypothetical protein
MSMREAHTEALKEEKKKKKTFGVCCFVFAGFDMPAQWEAWRSSVPRCLVDSVLEHLVERGIACICTCMGGGSFSGWWWWVWEFINLFLGAWSIKFSSHLVERVCGTPVPS